MAVPTGPLPGTSDIWPPQTAEWVLLEDTARDVFALHGHGELRTPIFERTELFTRSIGDETDIVQKEMYTFEDRGGRSLTLRPEGTAGVMRAMTSVGLTEGDERRVFYMGPMFRGERPAAGRRRQFHQIGAECVGRVSPLADVECVSMLMHYLDRIGITGARLLLNTRGTADDRTTVAQAMHAHFVERAAALCSDCQRRLETNIWRILDCKNEGCQDAIVAAPPMADLVGDESREFFAAACAGLEALDIRFEVDPRLVRGLDYYEHTVFEVVHQGLGAQDALAGGGRYALHLPGEKRPVQGVGFAVGMERLLIARESLGVTGSGGSQVQAYIVSLGAQALLPGLSLAADLRRHGVRVVAEQVGRSMKAQMRSANKLGVPLVLIRGDAELESGTVMLKDMQNSTQEEVPLAEVVSHVEKALG